MSCKATITLESDSPREAAELLRRVLGRSPVTVTQNFGSHCGEHVIDDRDLDENLVETLDDLLASDGDVASERDQKRNIADSAIEECIAQIRAL